MSDTATPDDHWRRLAADLGLDVGPEPERPAEPPEAVPAVKPPPHARTTEPPPALFDEGPPHEFDEPPAPPRRRGRFSEEVETSTEVSAEPAEAEIEGSDVEAAAVPEVRPEEAEEGSDELAEEKPRRRRRRGRRKKKGGEPATVEAGGEANGSAAPIAETGDDDDEEPTAEVVKNWNVPSWDDLIASLHRPER
jgi:ribonuclease E